MSMEMNKAMELLRGLVSEIERQTCEHEETHRGGAIWEICDSCGRKWADDEGGKPEFEWPESVEKAREFLAAHPAVEKAGGDERIVGELRFERQQMDRAFTACINERDAANARLHEVATACATAEQERDAALARVAELERQEPVAWMHDQPNRVDVIHRDVKELLQRVPGSNRGIHRPLDVSEHYTIPLYAHPVAQAQHSVLDDDMVLQIFADNAEHSERGGEYGYCIVRKQHALKIARELLAAAPGKEVGHE